MLPRGPSSSSSGACAVAGARRWLNSRNDYGPFAAVERAIEQRHDDTGDNEGSLNAEEKHTLKRVFRTALYGHTPPYVHHKYKSISRRVLGNKPKTTWLVPKLRHPDDRFKGRGRRRLSTAAAFELSDADSMAEVENGYQDDGTVSERLRPGDIVEARRCASQ
jgi:hypothetical protein